MRSAGVLLAISPLALVLALGCGSRAPARDGAGASLDALPLAEKKLELASAPRAAGATPAPLLSALKEELERNLSTLGKQPVPPYYVAYEAIAEKSVYVQASLGALEQSTVDFDRSLDVDVRVGDEKLDNTHRLRGEYDATRDFAQSEWLPLHDEPLAIRNAAWLATHAEYERALEELVRVRANKEVKVDEEDDSADFTKETPSVHHEAPALLDVSQPAWEERAKKWSLAFVNANVLESKIGLSATAETRFVVTSEGTSLQVGRTHVRVEITASTVAADGMRLERTETIDAPDARSLPADEAVLEAARHVIADLAALERAPVVEPFVGPAILDGRAAAVFFHEIFGHRVEGHRQKDEDEGQTFAHKVGQSVMPAFLNVFDDPSVAFLNGTPLNGHYPFDDEGVQGARASLIERGVLRGFVMSRSPVSGFDHSNGHGRRQRGHRIVARQGNLVVDPSRTVAPGSLKRRMLELLKRDGRPYGLRFHEITGGYTSTSREGSQAFKVLPVMVYRVHPDGREELVRGVDLEGTPLSALSRIDAAANDFEVFNGVCGAESGWVPVSATSPSLLVSQIEITRQEKAHDRPPLLPRPPRPEARRAER